MHFPAHCTPGHVEIIHLPAAVAAASAAASTTNNTATTGTADTSTATAGTADTSTATAATADTITATAATADTSTVTDGTAKRLFGMAANAPGNQKGLVQAFPQTVEYKLLIRASGFCSFCIWAKHELHETVCKRASLNQEKRILAIILPSLTHSCLNLFFLSCHATHIQKKRHSSSVVAFSLLQTPKKS
jgi:hypothetical protein